MSTNIQQCHHPLSDSSISAPSALNGRGFTTASGQPASTIATTKSTEDPWSLSDDEGRKLRWKVGREQHRKHGPHFHGDPLAEAIYECWDGQNYMAEALAQGCDLDICEEVRLIFDRACGLVREVREMRENERLAGRFAALVSE
jgi:hypothetical protein